MPGARKRSKLGALVVVAEPGSHHAARHAPRVAGAALAASAIATLALMLVAPPAPAATTTVRYRDLTLHVPAAWPVYRLARQPLRCVRFDRHALYLGRPSAEQRCPNRAIGRAAAALVEPIRAAGARRRPLAAKAPSGATIARLAASRVQIVAGGPRAARTTRHRSRRARSARGARARRLEASPPSPRRPCPHSRASASIPARLRRPRR